MPRSVAGLTSPPVAAPISRPCPAAAGAARVSARSVPTDRSAWSCCERCQVASNPIPYVAAAQPSPISSPAATACGLRAASNAASGTVSPRARAASRSTTRNAGHTRRNVTADPAMSSSAGASTRTASIGEPEPAGWSRNCHQPTQARATSSRSAPDRASSSRRPRTPVAAVRSEGTTSTAASASAPPATDSTCAAFTPKGVARPAPAMGGSRVSPACRADDAGIATAPASTARAPASASAAPAS